MLDTNKIGDSIIREISENLGLDPCSKEACREIGGMSITEAFESFLEYNGIIGYTYRIMNTYEELKAAEIKKGKNGK